MQSMTHPYHLLSIDWETHTVAKATLHTIAHHPTSTATITDVPTGTALGLVEPHPHAKHP